MKFITRREFLLKPLQKLISPLVGRQLPPILSNLLLQVTNGKLSLTSTNLEIEIIACITLAKPYENGAVTIPARKFFDICRILPEGAEISVQLNNDRILINSNYSRFLLSTLPAIDFPSIENWQSKIEFSLSQKIMKRLIESTQFSMANHDVRYYLNGMLFETDGEKLRTVATDGHRLAICVMSVSAFLPNYSIIIPRKSISELMRILSGNDDKLHIQIGSNNIRFYIDNFIIISKLIDGQFPNYRYVLPKKPDKILESNCSFLKQAFSRVAILSNERSHGVRLYISKNQLKIIANNSEQEEAEETLNVIYTGTDIEISFNVSYLLDILNILKCERVRILLTDSMSSVQIEDAVSKNAIYIVMPMRL